MAAKLLAVTLQIELESAEQAQQIVGNLSQLASGVVIEANDRDETSPDMTLTPTECKLLSALTNHDTIPEAAHKLCISPCTARKYLDNAYRKLEVHSLHRAIVVAVKRRIISL